MIILDTNVISETMKAAPDPLVLGWINRQAEDALFISTVTVAEISAGIHKLDAGKRRADLDRRLQDMVHLFKDPGLSHAITRSGSDSNMTHFFLLETFAHIEDLCPG